MKGIILAGGSGTRLYPITKATSKQLIPVYDKPMIYYPLSVLMLAGIRDILIITTPGYQKQFKDLLGDGSELGIKLEYKAQSHPNGLAESFLIAEDFIQDDSVALILGDNIFYGAGLYEMLQRSVSKQSGATIFGYQVKDPERFGIVEFDKNRRAVSITEKPTHPKSNYAVAGLYFYDNQVVDIAKKIKPSPRGELEISDINAEYLRRKELEVEIMSRGFLWMDAGTHESLLEASNFVATVQKQQNLRIASIEEVAYRMKYISSEQLLKLAQPLRKNEYGKYLIKLAEEEMK